MLKNIDNNLKKIGNIFGKFSALLKHSLIYSISNVASKASGLILLPIYTRYFSVEEFGRLGLLLITILITSQVIQLGQNQAIVRLSAIKEYDDKKKTIFFSIVFFILVIVLSFSAVSFLLLENFNQYFSTDIQYGYYLKISVFIIAFFVINNIFMNKLRATEESGIYTLLNLLKLLIVIVVAVYLIIVKSLGIEAVLFAQLLSEIVSFVVVLPKMLKYMEFKFDKRILITSLKFGLPLIFSTLAINLLNGSDRYMLKFLAGEKAIGLYELGYRVASILNMFIVTPLGISLLPAAYKMYKQKGDKEYYARLLNYLAIGSVFAGLFLAFWGNNIVQLIASNSSFYKAAEVVPIIILSFIFFGLSLIGTLGMYLTGKTIFIAVITFLAALLNVGLNYIFIPDFGMVGAAMNSAVSFLLLFIFSIIFSNKYYKIQYHLLNVTILIVAGILTYVIVDSVSELVTSFVLNCIKISIITVYPIMIYYSNLLSKDEKNHINKIFQRVLNK